MSTTRTLIDSKRANQILNSRKPITMAHVAGGKIVLEIQGQPTFVSKAQQEEKTPGQKQYFDKYIYNLKANSQEAMARPENRKLLTEAVKAESAGNVEEADKLFNAYLNAVQLSFNMIADRGRKFESGDDVKVKLGKAQTKAGHTAIVIESATYVAPAEIEAIKYDLTSLMAQEAPVDETADVEEDETVTDEANVTTK